MHKTSLVSSKKYSKLISTLCHVEATIPFMAGRIADQKLTHDSCYRLLILQVQVILIIQASKHSNYDTIQHIQNTVAIAESAKGL